MNIEQTVIDIIAEKLALPPQDVTLDSDLSTDFTADSLEKIELVLAFEEAFNINIPERVAREITTVRSVVERITEALLPSQQAS